MAVPVVPATVQAEALQRGSAPSNESIIIEPNPPLASVVTTLEGLGLFCPPGYNARPQEDDMFANIKEEIVGDSSSYAAKIARIQGDVRVLDQALLDYEQLKGGPAGREAAAILQETFACGLDQARDMVTEFQVILDSMKAGFQGREPNLMDLSVSNLCDAITQFQSKPYIHAGNLEAKDPDIRQLHNRLNELDDLVGTDRLLYGNAMGAMDFRCIQSDIHTTLTELAKRMLMLDDTALAAISAKLKLLVDGYTSLGRTGDGLTLGASQRIGMLFDFVRTAQSQSGLLHATHSRLKACQAMHTQVVDFSDDVKSLNSKLVTLTSVADNLTKQAESIEHDVEQLLELIAAQVKVPEI